VVDPVPGRQHDHTCIRMRPDYTEQREPVTTGQHDIEYHKVGPKFGQNTFEIAAVGTGYHLMAGAEEPGLHGRPDRIGVLNHQHSRIAARLRLRVGHTSRQRCSATCTSSAIARNQANSGRRFCRNASMPSFPSTESAHAAMSRPSVSICSSSPFVKDISTSFLTVDADCLAPEAICCATASTRAANSASSH